MIGILAGMGPRSTAPFIDTVIDECQMLYGAEYDKDFPRMMILSLPTPFYVDRPVDHQQMKTTITEGLQQLERAGAAFIAMPCNSAHVYYDELVAAVDVPLLNMINETVPYLTKGRKTTLLGTRITLESRLYQAEFSSAGVDFYFDERWQNRIDQIVSYIKAGRLDTVVEYWRMLLYLLEKAEVKQAVIACTDLNAVLNSVKTSIRLVDSGKALAKALVRQYRATH